MHTHRLNHQRLAALGPRKCFFGRFLLRLSKIKCSQVMSVVKLTPQNFIFVMKTFLECQAKISSEQLRKIEKIKVSSHSRAKKNILTIFPVLGKLTHLFIAHSTIADFPAVFFWLCHGTQRKIRVQISSEGNQLFSMLLIPCITSTCIAN